MKGAVSAIIVIMILLAPPVSAREGELRKLVGSCDESGNVEISMLHNGGAIKTDEINITSVFVRTGSEKAIEGVWQQENELNPLYLTGDFTKASFRTTGSEFKKRGPYDVHFVFFQRKEDLIPTTVRVGFDCPGFPCSSSVECGWDEACIGNVCTALHCKEGEIIEHHTCISKCNDFNPCTIDIYENGKCRHVRKEGECCRNDADCDRGKACAIDRCVSNVCVEEPVVCEAADDKCVYAFCAEPEGCIYQTDISCLADENEKREYLIVIGQAKVTRQPFLSGIFSAIKNFFSSLF